MESKENLPGPPVVSSPLFMIDYDGTLAEIKNTPMEAYPYEGARSVLHTLNKKYPLLIVTGRHLRDLSVLLQVELNAIGLHGLQKGTIGGDYAVSLPDSTRSDISWMRNRVPDMDGIRVEDKEYTFAVHYRGAMNESAIVEALSKWASFIPDSLTAIWGKKVVELKPLGIGKGRAVHMLVSQWSDCVPVYIGDDTTDEDAFEALNNLPGQEGLSIKVGAGETKARYRLSNVSEVIKYLKQYT